MRKIYVAEGRLHWPDYEVPDKWKKIEEEILLAYKDCSPLSRQVPEENEKLEKK